jgi:hypothetical protein
MILRPDLPFRGDRDYLQSATLFDDLVQWQPAPSPARAIDFTFHKKTDRQVGYQDNAPADQSALVATWRENGTAVFVVEGEQPIILREPYDEPALVARFCFGEAGVDVPADIGSFTPMEAVVAAFKALLHRTVVPSRPKLVFVRIRLRAPLSLPLRVRFDRCIGEFYQGSISSDAGDIGQIFFGEWR